MIQILFENMSEKSKNRLLHLIILNPYLDTILFSSWKETLLSRLKTSQMKLYLFAKEFKKSDAWLDGWQNVEKLWKTPEFKMIVLTERKAIQSKIPED